jgi:16S rRNA (adenine1518-N6/adenine1519-N6)-dimethyltransferase
VGKLSYLASVSETRAVLEAHGLMTKKALGQHFLINDGVVEKICNLAELEPVDNVLEVGPGIGTLTVALLQRAGRVTSIEMDADLPAVLTETCAEWAERFTLIPGDALAVSPSEVPFAPNKLVSNLPYAVAATIILDFFERYESLQSQTVMVQAEVADRMCAKVGTKNYGAYTVKLGLLAEYHGRFAVSEGNFFPPPRVKSAVIRMDRRSERLPQPLMKAAMTMADAAFATRRKTISNSMKTYFSNAATADELMLANIPEALERAGVSPKARGEALEREAFIDLGRAYLELHEQI